MFKGLVFLLGLASGAAGAAAWLLSEPEPGSSEAAQPFTQDHLTALRQRFRAALAEGERTGDETERRLRHQLDAFRTHPDRPATS